MDDRFPVQPETLLAGTVELLKRDGCSREIAFILAAHATLRVVDYDNWNGGTRIWELALEVPLHLFGQVGDPERSEIETAIRGRFESLLRGFDNDLLRVVAIRPRLETNDRWRQDATAWLAGQGITNQGRVRSDNIASREFEGLLFRSQAEINLFRALKALALPVAPLPVIVRGGAEYQRVEPDFLIVKAGITAIVEVDGDTYHQETPAEAQARLRPLELEGVRVIRVNASDCATLPQANACARRVAADLDRLAKL